MKKFLSSLMALVMVGALVTVAIGSEFFFNWDVKSWFNHWGAGEEQAAEQNDNLIGGMVLDTDPLEGNQSFTFLSAKIPVSAYSANGVSKSAETAYSITATVSPDNNAWNTSVEWEAAWKSESEWTKGKSVKEYVRATPSGKDHITSKTVIVACLQSFGEPIILTAKCKEAPEIKSSIQIDYMQRVRLSYSYPLQAFDAQNNRMNGGMIPWGGDLNVTLECGSGRAQNIFPEQYNYIIEGDYTLTDTYQSAVSLSPAGRDLQGGGDFFFNKPFTFESYSVDCGQIVFDNASGSGSLSCADEKKAVFALNRDGINRLLYCNAYGLSGPFLETYSEIMNEGIADTLTMHFSGLYTDLSAYYPYERIDLCKLTFSLTGTYATYNMSANVYITKALYTSSLGGIELDHGDSIF